MLNHGIVAVQSLSCFNSATPWTAARQASLFSTVSWSLQKLMFIESVMPSKYLNFCHPLLLLPSIFSQHQGVFHIIVIPWYYHITYYASYPKLTISDMWKLHFHPAGHCDCTPAPFWSPGLGINFCIGIEG